MEFKRHNTRYKVRFGGRIQQEGKTRWIETEEILGVALRSDNPWLRHRRDQHVAFVGAQASSEINLGKFNQGDYFAAVEDKTTPRTYLAYCIRMTPPTPGVSCACVRNTSWFPRPFRTF